MNNFLSTRREIVFGGLAATAAYSLGLLTSGQAQARSVQNNIFGGGGGDAFEMEYPRKIGLRHGNVVDALILNGTRHGRGGGVRTTVYSIEGDDYINSVDIRHGSVVDQLAFKTKNGIKVKGGGGGGNLSTLRNVRVLRIGGQAGKVIDQIKIEYITNYKPSRKIREFNFILDMNPPGTVYKEYQESNVRRMQAFSQTIETNRSVKVTASAEGEYFAQFSVSTELSISETNTKSMKNRLDEETKNGRVKTLTVPAKATALLIGRCQVMQDENRNYWLYPTAAPNWVVLTNNSYGRLVGHYDATSGAATQMNLRTEQQNGYRKIVASR